jgi:hypothetical protein
MTKISKKDWKYMKPDAEPGFNPNWNKHVINNAIAETDKLIAKKKKEFSEGLRERSDALATYFTSPKFMSKPADKYFGKKMTAYLRGDFIRRKLMDNLIQENTNKLYVQIKGKKKI